MTSEQAEIKYHAMTKKAWQVLCDKLRKASVLRCRAELEKRAHDAYNADVDKAYCASYKIYFAEFDAQIEAQYQ